MVSKDELKKIVMLSYLKEDMLEKLVPHMDVLTFDERETVFKEGDIPDRFYMLRRGKILLEKRISGKITVSVGSIKPGYSFGWSSMLDSDRYTSNAVCAEPCEVFSIRSKKMKKMIDDDPLMGYIFTQRLLRVIKARLDSRTEQFLRAIKNQPELQPLFEE